MRKLWQEPGADSPIVVIDAVEAGEICGGISGATFSNYSKTRRPKGNPPPQPVTRDVETGRLLWDQQAVEQWQKSRRGRGWWGDADGWRAPRPSTPNERNDDHG